MAITKAQKQVPSREAVVREIPKGSLYDKNSSSLGTHLSLSGLDQKSSGHTVHSLASVGGGGGGGKKLKVKKFNYI